MKRSEGPSWKRILDVTVSLLGLLVASPLFVLIAAAIKLESPGPVFYRQTRVGRGRQPFTMLKFRKMPEDLPSQGPGVTMRYDYRMTDVGRLLERTKLDELPQLINVLRGEMSVVGPRPELPKFVQFHPEMWDVVLSVKPGIFGPTQVLNRNESEFYPPGCEDVERYYVEEILPPKLERDGQYARQASLRLDLELLVRGVLVATIGTVTVRTLTTRRRQMASFGLLAGVGIVGMLVAHVAAEEKLQTTLAWHAILLAALVKPAFLLVMRVPQSQATSITAEDFLRSLWCAMGSSAVIVFLMYWLGHRDMSRLVLVLDTSFFLLALFLWKLFLYTAHFTFFQQRSRILARRLIWAAALAGPLSMGLTASLRYGPGIWLDQFLLYGSMTASAALIRPATFLLMRAPYPRRGAVAWLVAEWPRLALTTLAGSGLLVMASLLAGQRSIGRGDILLDALLFNLLITTYALFQNRRLLDAASEVPSAEVRRERLMLVGASIELGACIEALSALPERDYEIVGIVSPLERQRSSTVGGVPVIGEIGDLRSILEAVPVDTLVVLPARLDRASVAFAEGVAQERGCRCVSMNVAAGILSRVIAPPQAGSDAAREAADPAPTKATGA